MAATYLNAARSLCRDLGHRPTDYQQVVYQFSLGLFGVLRDGARLESCLHEIGHHVCWFGSVEEALAHPSEVPLFMRTASDADRRQNEIDALACELEVDRMMGLGYLDAQTLVDIAVSNGNVPGRTRPGAHRAVAHARRSTRVRTAAASVVRALRKRTR